MLDTMQNIGVSNKNGKDDNNLIDARILANYGDPGLTENFQFDLLSRFLVCMIESSNRVVTTNRIQDMIVVVERPKNLWIQYQGGVATSPTSQQRIDMELNVNLGDASNYTTSVIPTLNIPYNLGDMIKIRKKANFPSVLIGDNFFQSADSRWGTAQRSYASWHSQGANIPYISQAGGASALQQKCITPYTSIWGDNRFYICLNKAQYEAFVISQYPEQTDSLVSLFTNQSNFGAFYSQNGGYTYSQYSSWNFCSVQWEDANLAGRSRNVVPSSCIPTVIVSPSSFVVPSVRAIGTVNYSPVYITQS